ncbi:hypothetical protein ACHAWC_010212 [Mediolabrus comicus]
MTNDIIDSDDYDSDSSGYCEDDNKKESSRAIVAPMDLPTWEATKPSADGTILVRVKTLRGEYLTFSVHPSRHTIAHLRDAYWSTHDEWEGSAHELINFICKETDFFLPENKPLRELGIKHGSVLLLVIGDDLRHTGGFEFPPEGKGSPIPHKNIYRVPVITRNAAVPSDPTPQDTKRAKVPGWMDIHAVVNTPGGTATVDGNTITHKASDGVHYFLGEQIPPEFLKILDKTESDLLLQNHLDGQGSVNRSDLGSRLREIKIGESQDLASAMKKTEVMRTFHPHTLLHGVYIVHGEDHKEVEKALHTRYSLKRGGSSGEHFANLTQLNQHQLLSLGEQSFPGATLVFFSTNSFPKSRLGEEINDKPGIVYKVSPNWKDLDKKIFTNSISDFGEEDAFLPFGYDKDKVNFGRFSGNYLNYYKIGRYRGNKLEKLFSTKFLWACGFTGPEGAVYTFVHTETYKQLEKAIHAELISLGKHINGEYFLPPPTDTTVSQELAQLLNTTPSILNRNPFNLRTSHSILNSWVKDHYISHEIIWECMKEGAIVLCADKTEGVDGGQWRYATTGEKAIGRIPALDSSICQELRLFLKLHGFSGDYDNIKEDDFDKLGMAKDIRNAKDRNFVLIKVVTSDFDPPALEDAKEHFITIFGQSVYNRVNGIE